MTWFSKLMVRVLALPCMAIGVLILVNINAMPAWGKDINDKYQLVTQPPLQSHKEAITSGVYGPFSSYYFPTLSAGDEVCNLVSDEFVVMCFPNKIKAGILLAEADKTETIQAQLVAVNDGLSNRPMPEIILNFPLAEMDQKFLTQDIMKRLFKVSSIFDEPCNFTYQVDGQSQKNEEWLCSSFLKHFDRHTGLPRLYYELRIRPTALRSTSVKNTAGDAKQDWFDFFKSLQSSQVLNGTVDLLTDDLTANFTLNLTGYAKRIGLLIDAYYIDTPTIDMSAYDDLVSQISDLYSSDDKFAAQDAAGETQVGEKVYGPFDPRVCKVNRFVEYTNNTNDQRLYQDMFLVDCNHLRVYENKLPGWTIQLFAPKDADNSAAPSDLEKNAIYLSFRLQGAGASGSLLINNVYMSLQAYTILSYPLTNMPQDFFYSRVVRDTLRSAGQLEAPCAVSYIADGTQISKESLTCHLSYRIAYDGIDIQMSVDYGFAKCMQMAGNSCQKDALMKATSFLKAINESTEETAMKIEFEGGETITAELDLSEFDLAAINRLFNHIDLLD